MWIAALRAHKVPNRKMSKSTLAGCVVLVVVALLGLHARAQTRIPSMMTNPQGMLALHEQSYGHSVTWVELADGKVLLSGGGEFRVSKDGGLTWSEPFHGKDEKGSPVAAEALVRLSGKAVGMVASQRPTASPNSSELMFRRSDDDGRTWSSFVVINPKGPAAFMLQDVLLRTHSGRIILPVFLIIGQGGDFAWHLEEQPFVGGFVNGNFVSCSQCQRELAVKVGRFNAQQGRCNRRDGDGCGPFGQPPQTDGALLQNFSVRRHALRRQHVKRGQQLRLGVLAPGHQYAEKRTHGIAQGFCLLAVGGDHQ